MARRRATRASEVATSEFGSLREPMGMSVIVTKWWAFVLALAVLLAIAYFVGDAVSQEGLRLGT